MSQGVSMKICLLQCNPTSGDLIGNAAKITEMCQSSQGADLCVCSAQSICGPHASPLAALWDFQTDCREILNRMARELENYPPLVCAIAGAPFLISGGIALSIGNIFHHKGENIAIIEDDYMFPGQPEAQILLHMNATAYRPGAQARLESRLKNLTANKWLVSVNLAGGCGQYVYHGQSFAVKPGMVVCARAAAFRENILVVDTDDLARSTEPLEEDADREQWRALVLGVRDFTRKSGALEVIIGLSGGMDSAFVACVAAEALGAEHVVGVLMPSPFSSSASVEDALRLAQNLDIRALTTSIAPVMNAFGVALAEPLSGLPAQPNDLVSENLQARIRGDILMAIANRTGALVLNTGNKSESAMGYCTLYGDTAGALAVIGDIFKTRVYELAAWRSQNSGKELIPQNIFDKPPSAELKPDQKDTDSLPPYSELDPRLAALLAGTLPADPAAARKLRAKIFKAAFKRAQSPPALLVGSTPPIWPGIVGGKLNM